MPETTPNFGIRIPVNPLNQREQAQAFNDVDALLAGPSILTDGFEWDILDQLVGEAAGKHLSSGYDATNDIAYIRSVDAGTEFTPLHLAGSEASLWSYDGSDLVETLTARDGIVNIGRGTYSGPGLPSGVDTPTALGVVTGAVGAFDSSLSPMVSFVRRSSAAVVAAGSASGLFVHVTNENAASIGDSAVNIWYRQNQGFNGGGAVCLSLNMVSESLGVNQSDYVLNAVFGKYARNDGHNLNVETQSNYGRGVIAASNTTPIKIKSHVIHQINTDDEVIISGVLGNTAANGTWTITKTSADEFTLNGSVGNGTYTSGGTISLHSARDYGVAGNRLSGMIVGSGGTGNLTSGIVFLGSPTSHFWTGIDLRPDSIAPETAIAVRIPNATFLDSWNVGVAVGTDCFHLIGGSTDNKVSIDPQSKGTFVGGSTPGAYAFNVHSGANQNFGIFGPISLADGISISSINDANVLKGMEFVGSLYYFRTGFVGIGTSAPQTILHLAQPGATDSVLQVFSNATRTWTIGLNGSLDTFRITDNTVGAARLVISNAGNIGFGVSTFGTSAAKTLALADGTPPTTLPSGQSQLWSFGAAAGDDGGAGSQLWFRATNYQFAGGHVAMGNAGRIDTWEGVPNNVLMTFNVEEWITGSIAGKGKQVAGKFYLLLDPSTDQDPWMGGSSGSEAYGTFSVCSIYGAKNFNQIHGVQNQSEFNGSGTLRGAFGTLGITQLGGSGSVSENMTGVFGEFRTTVHPSTGVSPTGTITGAARGLAGIVQITHGVTVTAVRPVQAYYTQSAGTVNNVAMLHATTPVITGGTISTNLYGLRVEDMSAFGAFVSGSMWNIKSFGANSSNVFEGAVILGGSIRESDIAATIGMIQGQAAYPQATTNTSGGDVFISPGIGRRLFTAITNIAGAVTVTITVNGVAVALASGTFGLGSDDSGPQLAATATNLAAAINANSTLNTKVKATASGAIVYLTKKPACHTLTIATNQPARISTTVGIDGAVRIAAAPPETANYGALSLGAGPFDGSTSGFFVGQATGTHLAMNAQSGFVGDFISCQIAGVESFRVSPSGNVFISNSIPALFLLDTTASAKDFVIEVEANVAQLRELSGSSGSLLNLDLANNFVGVGVLAPAGVFSVAHAWASPASTNLTSVFDAYGDAARFAIRRANGTVASPTQVLTGEALGNLQFRGYHSGAAFGTVGAVALTAIAEESFTSTAQGTRLGIFTVPIGSATQVERVRITSLGSVWLAAAGALATTATDGDVYMPSCAGTPTGTPTGATGMIAVRFDSTNNKLYAHLSGTWKSVTLT